MRRFWSALSTLVRRWRFVEEGGPAAAAPSTSPLGDEAWRLRRALEREERLIADYRRVGCLSLAKDREASARVLRMRLMLLKG